ncbi:hypothetical protein PENSPDRAFT_748560 [Peniophora sp. CONT]|nr:hypothetical protein PENSPDRAFT_748560 [Peniophora sp. CONT]
MHLVRSSLPRATADCSSNASSVSDVSADRGTTPVPYTMKTSGTGVSTSPVLWKRSPSVASIAPRDTLLGIAFDASVTITVPIDIPTATVISSEVASGTISVDVFITSHGVFTSDSLSLSPSATPTTPTSSATSTASTTSTSSTTAISQTSVAGDTSSSSDSAGLVGGVVGGGVALLLLAGIAVLRLRKRRGTKQRLTANDASIINNIVQYPSAVPVTHNRKGESAGTRVENLADEAHAEGLLVSSAPEDSPVLDVAAASAMFRQLERFLRSVHADRDEQRHRESASVDDRNSDSLPQYSQVADL